jgi:hypothetical protein
MDRRIEKAATYKKENMKERVGEDRNKEVTERKK